MRRLLRYALWALLVLPLGSVGLVAVTVYRALTKVRAADPEWSPATLVLIWARVWCTVYSVPFDFMLSILHNEGASTPRPIRIAETAAFQQAGLEAPETVYPLGDLSIAKGPSVGPGQVLRVNVERLWQTPGALGRFAVRPHPLELAVPGNERAALWAAVQVAKESLTAADGDLNEAARIYNGGPRYNSAAIAYAQRADDFRGALS